MQPNTPIPLSALPPNGRVENRTSTSFDIYNPTAVNMILGWQILGVVA